MSEKSENSAETKWLAYGRGNEPLTFTWRKKTEDHHVELPLRLRGSLTQLTSLGEDSTAIAAEVALEIVQGAARQVHIRLPEKITINQVAGAMVADWEMKNGELAITFLEPVEHTARFVISAEARLPRDGGFHYRRDRSANHPPRWHHGLLAQEGALPVGTRRNPATLSRR